MDIAFLHNPTAGDGSAPEAGLLRVLRERGHTLEYRSTDAGRYGPEDLGSLDLVVVAGGDGTVEKVALAWAGAGVPLAVFPAGTANNLARAFGMPHDPEEMAAVLARGKRAKLDIGVIRGAWGEKRFLEAAGLGLFPRMLDRRCHDKRDGRQDPVDRQGSVEGGRLLMAEVLAELDGIEISLDADGEDLSGVYLMVEAMNVGTLGPSLPLAPAADPGDGWLDLVLVRDDRREALRRFLLGDGSGSDEPDGLFLRRTVRTVRFTCADLRLHADDSLWPDPTGAGAPARDAPRVEIAIDPTPLEMVVP